MDSPANDAGPSADSPGDGGSALDEQVEDRLTHALRRLSVRPGSEPGGPSVSVAVEPVEHDEVVRRWHWPSWRPDRVGLAGAIGVACVGLIAALHFEQAPAPESPARESSVIDRVIHFEGGATIISHSERDGETTWLHTFELNWSDQDRPAARLAEDADVAAEDGIAERADDTAVAEPILKITEDRPVVPARSTRRGAIPVRDRDGMHRVLIKTGAAGKKPVYVIPLNK